MNALIELVAAEMESRSGCHAEHWPTVPVAILHTEEDAWQSDVEVFRLDRIDATRAYAWARIRNRWFQSTIILGVPPVNSTAAAVAH